MRRATSILVLALPAAAVLLVALVHEPRPEHPSSAIETGVVQPGAVAAPRGEERAGQPPKNSLAKDPSESSGAPTLRRTDRLRELALTEGHGMVIDEETSRKRLRERVTWEIRRLYAPLIAELGLTPNEQEALTSLLIEGRIAGTWTTYKDGNPWTEEERAEKIAAIIGNARLQAFQALVERKLPAYGEILNIEDLLQHYGVPLADSQREGLLKILVEVREQYKAPPPSTAGHDPLDRLEYTLAQRDEFQRHVVELAPSVLSAEQVRYLFEQYQHMSYERATALEEQRRAVAAGEDVPILGAYPGWHPMWQRH